MVLHYNQDGSIEMKLNVSGKVIEKIFINENEKNEFINSLIL